MILPPYVQNVVIVIYVANNAPALFPSFPCMQFITSSYFPHPFPLHDEKLSIWGWDVYIPCTKFQSVQLKASSSPDVAQPALQIAPTPPHFVPGSVLLAVSVPEGRWLMRERTSVFLSTNAQVKCVV